MFSGPVTLVMRARVVQCADAVRTRILSTGAVIQDRIVRPTVPQSGHHPHIFLGALVAIGMARRALAAVVAGRCRQPGRDDVPADPSAADVVQRGKLPRQVEWLGVGGGAGGDQPDPAGHAGQRSEHGDRFQPGARRTWRVLADRQRIGEEHRIEQPRFRLLREVRVIADVRQRPRRGCRASPGGLMVPAAMDEEVEVKLPSHARYRSLSLDRSLSRLSTLPQTFEPLINGWADARQQIPRASRHGRWRSSPPLSHRS